MQRLALADAAGGRVASQLGHTAAGAMSARLLTDYAWSDRTTTSRNSQWKSWVEFCHEDQRPVLPVSEAHFVAFIGWLAVEREAGRRQVSSRSIPQYLSAVRGMQVVLYGTPVPSFPFVWHVLRGYRRWEEEHYPQREVRCGIPATVVQQICAFGIATDSLPLLRDAAVCCFSYCMNGLRESSVVSLETSKVSFPEDGLVARLSVVKGQPASQAPLVAYHRAGVWNSPLDLWLRWKHARGNHPRFFALPAEQMKWSSGALSRSLQNILQATGPTPPPHGKFTSHSLRIGSHTEQVLIGIPLEVRLARFGWGSRSQEMANLYFDRTIRLSAASFWIFGPPVAAPVTTASSTFM